MSLSMVTKRDGGKPPRFIRGRNAVCLIKLVGWWDLFVSLHRFPLLYSYIHLIDEWADNIGSSRLLLCRASW
jgi:hypothetical protein